MADVQLSAGQEVALGGSKFTSSLDSDAFNIPSLGGGKKTLSFKEKVLFFSLAHPFYPTDTVGRCSFSAPTVLFCFWFINGTKLEVLFC